MKFHYDQYYPVKVWVTTILVGSILCGLIYQQIVTKDDDIELIWLIPIIIIAIAPIFVPTFLLGYFTYTKLITLNKPAKSIKLITAGITLLGYILNFLILGYNFFNLTELTPLLLAFLLASVIASFAYKISRYSGN